MELVDREHENVRRRNNSQRLERTHARRDSIDAVYFNRVVDADVAHFDQFEVWPQPKWTCPDGAVWNASVWKWKGHTYGIKTLIGLVARVYVDGRRVHLFDFVAITKQYDALMVMGQLGVTELVAAKIFGFLAG